MPNGSQEGNNWKRYKEFNVPWSRYDRYRKNEIERILDLNHYFKELDKPVQGREFLLSDLVTLLLFKILFSIPYRSLASMIKGFKIYSYLGMKRAPCYKTFQRTMNYINIDLLEKINNCLIDADIELSGVDASGLKTTRKSAWVQIRFGIYQRKKDFKKLHIFVDLQKKKIINCILTNGTASDHKHLSKLIQKKEWLRINIVLGDRGYDTRNVFKEVSKIGAKAGIRVRKNACSNSRGCPSRKKAVIQQKKDYNKWKNDVQYNMRSIVESIFSATKRRFGEFLFSVKESFRVIETWLRTILWNITIYPR